MGIFIDTWGKWDCNPHKAHLTSQETNKIMKMIQELNEKKIPIVLIDSSLGKYKTMPIFQDKANEALRTVGLPKLPTK